MNPLVSKLDLKTLLDIHKNDIFTSFHCHKLGTIHEFYPDTQTADIKILHKAVVDGEPVEYPTLADVPVFVPAGSTGNNAALTMPVNKGDTCLVLFSDRDMDAWLVQGKTDAIPPTQRKHDITDGLAIVGFRPKTNPIPDYNADAVELRNADGKVAIAGDGLINIRNDKSNLHELLLGIIKGLKDLQVNTNSGLRVFPATGDLEQLESKLGKLLKG